MKRFFVQPCDDNYGRGTVRTWDIYERGLANEKPRVVRSAIKTRIEARSTCQALNEGKETPR